MEFVKIVLDRCRSFCYLAADAARACGVALAEVWVLVMALKRWRLFRAERRRGRVVRVWFRGFRFDFVVARGATFRLTAVAVMQPGPGFPQARVVESFAMGIKRPESGATQAGGAVAPVKRSKLLGGHPVLAEYLTALQYEDGKPREPSFYMVKVRGSMWEVTLKDPTECRQLVVQVPDDGLIYAALEALLVSETCPWQPDAFALARQPKRKK